MEIAVDCFWDFGGSLESWDEAGCCCDGAILRKSMLSCGLRRGVEASCGERWFGIASLTVSMVSTEECYGSVTNWPQAAGNEQSCTDCQGLMLV